MAWSPSPSPAPSSPCLRPPRSCSSLFFPLNLIPLFLPPRASPVRVVRQMRSSRDTKWPHGQPGTVSPGARAPCARSLSLVLSYLNGSSTPPLLHATPLLRSSTPSLFRSDNPPHHHASSSGLRIAPARHPATLVHLFVFARYSITVRSWDVLLLRTDLYVLSGVSRHRGFLRRRSLKEGQSFIVSRLPLGIRCIIVVDSCIFPGLFVICRFVAASVSYNVALVHRAQLKCVFQKRSFSFTASLCLA